MSIIDGRPLQSLIKKLLGYYFANDENNHESTRIGSLYRYISSL